MDGFNSDLNLITNYESATPRQHGRRRFVVLNSRGKNSDPRDSPGRLVLPRGNCVVNDITPARLQSASRCSFFPWPQGNDVVSDSFASMESCISF